ncbi:hypothetical protein AQUCO_02000325v1 [Aquilegia coerulea]|uniref:Uncharacterized protein n=1 Tax=Aquilegia coerulea TaxID=218851 RepID=A0A2G5DH00_AQUCA|nr:hypothetical protein AQUCO_02000325v1 [Aquilegia coerulea]
MYVTIYVKKKKCTFSKGEGIYYLGYPEFQISIHCSSYQLSLTFTNRNSTYSTNQGQIWLGKQSEMDNLCIRSW